MVQSHSGGFEPLAPWSQSEPVKGRCQPPVPRFVTDHAQKPWLLGVSCSPAHGRLQVSRNGEGGDWPWGNYGAVDG